MNIKVYHSAEEIGKAAAAVFAAQVITKPASVLGLATGSSPVPTYRRLIELYQEGIVDFSQTVTFNLDEYIGLSKDHPCSYHAFMQENLFSCINVKPENIHIPSGDSDETQGASYDCAIQEAGGIDLQILGIGNNGHIAFNEPQDTFTMGTHIISLTESTIEANARFFESREEVPRQAISMGIGSIMRARRILLIATGKAKAEAVYRMAKEEVSPMCPASILQLHPDATIMVDEEAAAMLS